MSSTRYDQQKRRWRVSWIRTDGTRATRSFTTPTEAQTFADGITDERNGRPGPSLTKWTPQWVQAKVRRSITVDENGCWIWQPKGGTNRYAQVVRRTTTGHVTVLMHRASYEAFVGPIPDGLEIDHLCAVTRCVNPDHLEPVTQAENLRRRDERLAVSA